MNNNSPLADAELKLKALLQEIAGTPTQARAEAYLSKFEKPSEKDRFTLVSHLIDILLTRDYSRLPEIVPAGATEEEPENVRELRRIARQEARALLADVLAKMSRVLATVEG